MDRTPAYLATEPTPDDVAARPGLTLLEFGAPDCGICIATQPAIVQGLAAADPADPVTHLRIHDGAGRRLGRHFGVKLWPTLVLLRDGVETGRLVRPSLAAQVKALFAGDG